MRTRKCIENVENVDSKTYRKCRKCGFENVSQAQIITIKIFAQRERHLHETAVNLYTYLKLKKIYFCDNLTFSTNNLFSIIPYIPNLIYVFLRRGVTLMLSLYIYRYIRIFTDNISHIIRNRVSCCINDSNS